MKFYICPKTFYRSLFFLLSIVSAGCHTFGGKASENNNPSVSATPTAAAPAPSASPAATETTGGDLKLQKNLLAFGAGTLVADKSSESPNDKARYVIDEASFYWQTEDGKTENQSITLELPAATVLKTVGFDTSQPTFYDRRAAKDVLVEVSNVSGSDGFERILAASLAEDKDGQNFPVEKEISARFVRITARSNFGSPTAILIKEVRGYGEQEAQKPMPNASGTYKFGDLGELHLKQDGGAIVGCYQYNEGVVEGTIDGRTLSLTRTETGGVRGFAAINFTDGGKKFIGTVWEQGKSKDYDVLKLGEKISDKIGNCKHFAALDSETQDAAQSRLAESLEKTGRALLYGINFDFNSDRIRDESRPTLEKVVMLLKEKPDWRLNVEGHTDNIGGDAFNLTLSEKRAAAVVKYLSAAGIDENRLKPIGMGLTKPFAANDSEAGRAQNRRVELVKQ